MTTNRSVDEPNSMEGKINPLDYVIIWAKHSRMIIFSSVAAMILVYIYLFCVPNTYVATSRLLPPQQNMTLSGQILDSLGGASLSAASAGGGGVGGLAANLLGFKSPADLYVGMLTSDTVFDSIINRFNLKQVYNVKYIEYARKALYRETKIEAGRKDGIISVQISTDTPERSAEISNAFVDELDKLLQRIARQEAKERLSFLESERIQAIQNLNKAEESLRHYSEKNSVLQIDTQTKGVLEYIARLRAEIDAKEVGIQVLRQQATAYNFDVVRMETEVKGLREKLRGAETQYDNCITDVCLPTSKAPALALEYVRLYREAKFQEVLYQLYMKLVEIARLDMARDNAVIQVVDYAKPPEIRSNKRLPATVITGILTFFIMFFVILGREALKKNEDNLYRLRKIKESLHPWKDMWVKIKK